MSTRIAISAAFAALALATGSASAGGGVGAPGAGDPYFPTAGNGGYDVEHYSLAIRYRPGKGRLRGTAAITATATEPLRRFNLDLRRLHVSRVLVDGAEAEFDRHAGELTITPAAPLGAGEEFAVLVRYRGRPRPAREPDGSRTGWLTTNDGAVVLSEPRGAPSWFPCNDHPTDKATYDIRINVPRRLRAISNGILEGRHRAGGRKTFAWRESSPMATYLATVAIGRFKLKRSTVAGVPSWVAIDRRFERRGAIGKTGEILKVFGDAFGPYPFGSTGAILDREDRLGVALETQTRPVYPVPPNAALVAHELAHQWFGDSVSLERWRDMWLNEGFATWSEWLWTERSGGPTAAAIFRRLYRTPESLTDFWNPPPGRPKPATLFASSVYVRGGMTLQALRERVGDATFFAILRRWVGEHAYGNASIDDFIALAEEESGRDLEGFFTAWLYEQGKPRTW